MGSEIFGGGCLFELIEHPEITYTLRTGYPSWNQPKTYQCELCGEELNSDEVYEDSTYDYLCEECLMKLHKKEF